MTSAGESPHRLSAFVFGNCGVRPYGTQSHHGDYPRTPTKQGTQMDKDRIEGAANQAKGAVKQAAGQVTGDKKLQAEGTLDKAKGRVESAVGGAKEALRGK
jgi:uncharacterized protein YjbJ (UPF0337 family)